MTRATPYLAFLVIMQIAQPGFESLVGSLMWVGIIYVVVRGYRRARDESFLPRGRHW